jgi:hypothetical protein
LFEEQTMVKPARIAARLTEEQRRQLAAAAMRQQMTESAMLRQLIDSSLLQLPKQLEAQSPPAEAAWVEA